MTKTSVQSLNLDNHAKGFDGRRRKKPLGVAISYIPHTTEERIITVEKVAREAQRQNGTILTDLRTRDRSSWLAFFPILWLNEFEVSANTSREAGLPPSVGPSRDDSHDR